MEEDIFYNFSNFVESLNSFPFVMEDVMSMDDEDAYVITDVEITFKDVVRFCTGSAFVTKDMKKNGVICFSHPDIISGERVTAIVCALKLQFPVTNRYCGDSDAFIKHFCEDIISSPGFGRP